MAYGLEVWNASGVKTVSITDRLARYHGTYNATLTSGASSVSVSVPGFDVTSGDWFFAVTTPNSNVALTPVSGGFTLDHSRSGFTFTGGTFTIIVWRS